MQYVDGKRARMLVENKSALLVDTRTPVEFRDGSLPGAKNLPSRNLMNEIVRMGTQQKKVPIVLFGSPGDNTIEAAVRYAENLNVKVYVLKEMTDWFEK